MDVLLLQLVVDELRTRITGARIAKIHQPTPDTIVFRLWNGRENLRLLLATGRQARLHLTTSSYPNPFTPPRFCQLLRARLTRLDAIEQVREERIVCLQCSGPEGHYRLYVELFGSQGNLLLADDQGVIVDLLNRSGSHDGRLLLPGHLYRFPDAQPQASLQHPLPPLTPACRQPAGFRSWLLEHVKPMSSAQATALAWQVGQGSAPEEVLNRFRDLWRSGRCQPGLALIDAKELLVPCPPADLPVTPVAESLSAYLDAHFSAQRFQAGGSGMRSELQRILGREQKKLQKRLDRIAQESHDKQWIEQRRHDGDLLLANLHQVRKGMTEARITDYGCDPPVEVLIHLDPRLTPQENAQALFKRYKKEKRGIEHVDRRTRETRQELDWQNQLQLALDEAASPEDLQELADELRLAGLYRDHGNEPASRRRTPDAPTLNRAVSPGGFLILWGRNNRGNDHLTTRVAAAHDYWFHIHEQPGCHLVLRRDSAEIAVPDEDLHYAAALAAGYSRAKEERSVTVICCLAKDVYKVKGAHPGQVSLRRFNTLQVAPLRLEASQASG